MASEAHLDNGARGRSSRGSKSATAFRTISEVAGELDVAQHVLRFWESKFPQVRPLKRGGGRRYYRPEDVDLLRQIRSLLYDEGYTIKGAQKLLKTQRRSGGQEGAPDHEDEGGQDLLESARSGGALEDSGRGDDRLDRQSLLHLRSELRAAREELRRLIG